MISLFLVLLLVQVSSSRVINVPGDNTLEYYLCRDEGKTLVPNTALVLATNTTHFIGVGHYCVLHNLVNVTIKSDNENLLARIKCNISDWTVDNSRGFAFVSGVNISLTRLLVSHCGGPLPLESINNDTVLPVYVGTNQTATIILSYIQNLNLANITVINYYGFAIMAVNTLGQVTMNGLNISNSSSYEICDKYNTSRTNYTCHGAGLMIYTHDNCRTNDNNNEIICETLSSFSNSLTISNSVFSGNFYFNKHFVCVINVFQFQPSRVLLVAGAAVTIFSTQSSFKTTTAITSSEIYDNSGDLCGGIMTVFINTPFMSDIILFNVTVRNNSIPSFPCVGTGMVAYIHFTDDFLNRVPTSNISITQLLSTWTPLVVTNSTFSKHIETALKKRSSTVYIAMRSQLYFNVAVRYEHILFINNVATYTGICLKAQTDYEPMANGKKLVVTLKNIKAEYNYQAHSEVLLTNSSLFVFYRIGRVHIEGEYPFVTSFINNNGSVIDAFDTEVYLQGHLEFSGNRATFGPAILLRSGSFLVLADNTSILFQNNTAFLYGGAIYSVEQGTEDDYCTIQIDSQLRNISSLPINLTFIDNFAYIAGNSIYMRPIHLCFQSRMKVFPRYLSNLYSQIFKFPGSNNFSQIASVSASICKCVSANNGTVIPQCDQQFNETTIYPGDTITVGLIATDDVGIRTESQVNASFSHDQQVNRVENPILGWRMEPDQELNSLAKDNCRKLNYTIYSNMIETSGRLNFAAPGRPTFAYVPIKLKHCPPGFILVDDSCSCKSFLKEHKIQCDPVIKSIQKPRDAWVGILYTNESHYIGYSEYCPVGFCNHSAIELVTTDINNSICLYNRVGPLCANCKDGYSAVEGSTECRVCKNKGSTMLIGNATSGLIAVVLLFLFKLTLNTGTIGGLIFYANVYDIISTIPTVQTFYIPFLQVIQLINLQQAFGSCLYNGMTYYVTYFIRFVYSIYLWVIVIVIVIIARYSSRIARLLMESSVQVLMTLIHLSFAKILYSTIQVFSPIKVYTERMNYTAWLYNGTIHYGTGIHLLLLIISSLFTILFILPYILLALFGSYCLRFRCVNKFRPFIDTIYAPYKDKYRFWFGARLLLLVFQSAVTTFHALDPFYQYLLQLILVMSFTLWQAYLKPFTHRWANLLDNWCMINVIALVLINMYYVYGGSGAGYILLSALIIVCATIAGVLVYHISLFVKKVKNLHCCRFKFRRSHHVTATTTTWVPAPVRSDYEKIDESDNDCNIREPLLESLDYEINN